MTACIGVEAMKTAPKEICKVLQKLRNRPKLRASYLQGLFIIEQEAKAQQKAKKNERVSEF